MGNNKSTIPRIAMISTHGYVAAQPPLGALDTGGQVVYVLELSKKLAQLGYEVDVWTRGFEDQPDFESVAERVRIVRARCGGREFIPKEYLYEHLPEWEQNALAIIRAEDLDYEFIDSHYWDAGLAGMHLAERLAVPHLHTPHSLGIWKRREMEADFPGDKKKFEKLYNFTERIKYERLIHQSAYRVLATTPQQVELLHDDYGVPAEKCFMIPPGYDDNRFFPVSESSKQALKQRLGFTGPTVMAIGRLARNKGYDLLIEAFRLVAERIPDATLHLALGGVNLSEGEEKVLGELKTLVTSLELNDRIRFGSFIPDEALADTYRAADVFVLSSRYEPFGMTAIEAMACGTPTVITIHGGLYQSVTFGRHALYADPFDRDDLGITICKILQYPRLSAQLAHMGGHLARSLYTWTGIAQQLVALVDHGATKESEGNNVNKVSKVEWDETSNDAD